MQKRPLYVLRVQEGYMRLSTVCCPSSVESGRRPTKWGQPRCRCHKHIKRYIILHKPFKKLFKKISQEFKIKDFMFILVQYPHYFPNFLMSTVYKYVCVCLCIGGWVHASESVCEYVCLCVHVFVKHVCGHKLTTKT